ncbi:hypothetical protein ACFXTH_022329 [Malus domestica]
MNIGSNTKWNHETRISRSIVMMLQTMACIVLDLEWAARSAGAGNVGAFRGVIRRQVASLKRLQAELLPLGIENPASFVGMYVCKTKQQQQQHSQCINVYKSHDISYVWYSLSGFEFESVEIFRMFRLEIGWNLIFLSPLALRYVALPKYSSTKLNTSSNHLTKD